MSETKYILTLTEDQEAVVEKACEFYARVLNGQFDEIAFETLMRRISEDNYCNLREQMEQHLLRARECAFPELGRYAGHHHGVGRDETSDRAWNIYQVLRHTRSWHKEPKGGYSVDFDPPMDVSGVGLPKCEAKKEPRRQ